MRNIIKKEIEWNNSTLTLETGEVACQTNGSVTISYKNCKILCTVVAADKPMENINFFPLTVHYQEKFYAAGKFPSGFLKRESKPREHEVLTSRLIDRSIRPLFDDNYKNEVQVLCNVISYDSEVPSDILAIIGTSAALTISDVPFNNPIAATRVCLDKENNFITNPSYLITTENKLNITLAGTKENVVMVESEANLLPQDKILSALQFGLESLSPLIDLINSLKDEAGKPKQEVVKQDYSSLYDKINSNHKSLLELAYSHKEKQTRSKAITQTKNNIVTKELEEAQEKDSTVTEAVILEQIHKIEKEIMKNKLANEKTRIDGRSTTDIRDISIKLDISPNSHGSALFTRGETQAMIIGTLGTLEDEQYVDGLEDTIKEPFLLQYNFPPFAVGEVGALRAPGRREIGHGYLARKSILPIVPKKGENFDYTIRLVSEITESNGSSSMASVCGSSLALRDMGIETTHHIAGIAMGLVKCNDEFIVLSDIMGDEDALGDMDFKVAGTRDAISALQMDVKISGISLEIMSKTLSQACEGLTHILDKMDEACPTHRTEFKDSVPKFISLKIDKDDIKKVIGSGGRVIKELCETSKCKIDIADNGQIKIVGKNLENIEKAKNKIASITEDIKMGGIYEGVISNITDFGAFVTFLESTSGLIHISEFSDSRLDKVEEVANLNDKVKFKVIGRDKQGKIRLSYRCVNQETGEDLSENYPDIINNIYDGYNKKKNKIDSKKKPPYRNKNNNQDYNNRDNKQFNYDNQPFNSHEDFDRYVPPSKSAKKKKGFFW